MSDSSDVKREYERLKSKYLMLRKVLSKKSKEFDDFHNEYINFIENLADAVFMFDHEGRFTFLNGEGERLTGYPRDHIYHRHFRMLLSLDDISDGFKLMYKTMKGDSTSHNLFRIRKRDGSTIVVDLSCSPIKRNGKIVGVMCIARDMTARKKMEKENKERVEKFKELNSKLEAWNDENRKLKKEVNSLLKKMGKEEKYLFFK